jgi:hypothetical protein
MAIELAEAFYGWGGFGVFASGTAVLGRFPAFRQEAEKIGGARLKIPYSAVEFS